MDIGKISLIKPEEEERRKMKSKTIARMLIVAGMTALLLASSAAGLVGGQSISEVVKPYPLSGWGLSRSPTLSLSIPPI